MIKHSFHQYIFYLLSEAASWEQQPNQRSPDNLVPIRLLRLIWRTQVFPGQPRNVISPACPGRPPEFILYFWWNLPVTLHPGGTHIRYPYHLNWLLRTDSGHTLRENPGTSILDLNVLATSQCLCP